MATDLVDATRVFTTENYQHNVVVCSYGAELGILRVA